MKKCPQCRSFFPPTSEYFPPLAGRKDGLRPQCRRCHATNSRQTQVRRAQAPGTHTKADVQAQWASQRGLCFWCGEAAGDPYHVDHFVPLARGGSNGRENLVISCPACNLSKGAKLPVEFLLRRSTVLDGTGVGCKDD